MSSAVSVSQPAQAASENSAKKYGVNKLTLKGLANATQVEQFWAQQTQKYAKELTLAHAMIHDDMSGTDPVDMVTRAWHRGAYPIVELFRESLGQLRYIPDARGPPSTQAGMTCACFEMQLRKCLRKFSSMRVALSGDALAKCCKYMGDLHRYQVDYQMGDIDKAWTRALDCYRAACRVNPHDGKPYHIIAVLYRSKSLLLSFYYSCRALNANRPFMPSREAALMCFGASEKVLRNRVSSLGYRNMNFPDGRVPNWVHFAISSKDEADLDVCWQHTCLYMHSMIYTKTGIDKFNKWLSYAYLPLLKARIASPSSVKLGTRIAILDLSAVHQYSKYHTKPFAPIADECQCAMHMLIQTLHLCIRLFIDGFHDTSAAKASQTRFAMTYISAFLLYMDQPAHGTIESMMCYALDFRLAQASTLVADFVAAMNMLLDASAAESGITVESMGNVLVQGLPEDLALQGIRWIKPFHATFSDVKEDVTHEGLRQLRLLALAKRLVDAKVFYVNYKEQQGGFEIAEALLHQAKAQEAASNAAASSGQPGAKKHVPVTGPFSGATSDCRFVFDTNCFIEGLEEIEQMLCLGWQVIVPAAVVAELRGLLSKGKGEVCGPASKALEFVSRVQRRDGESGLLQICTRRGQQFNLNAPPEPRIQGKSMDDTIIETCGNFEPDVALVTNDCNMRIKAAMLYGRDIHIGDLKDIQRFIRAF
ncbi:hypothetical protein EC988_003136 [Linderina pennispora]|nr:hypothetical protein EC988_003136 [Linderina pennispora]